MQLSVSRFVVMGHTSVQPAMAPNAMTSAAVRYPLAVGPRPNVLCAAPELFDALEVALDEADAEALPVFDPVAEPEAPAEVDDELLVEVALPPLPTSPTPYALVDAPSRAHVRPPRMCEMKV